MNRIADERHTDCIAIRDDVIASTPLDRKNTAGATRNMMVWYPRSTRARPPTASRRHDNAPAAKEMLDELFRARSAEAAESVLCEARLMPTGPSISAAGDLVYENIVESLARDVTTALISERWLAVEQPEKRQILELLHLNFSLNGATLVPTMRKPFDILADGPLVLSSRGDRI